MIQQNRQAIVFGLCVLLVMSAAAYLQSGQDKGDGNPSSYSNLNHGGKAAYLFLQQSGVPVERWERSPKELPADGQGILVIIAHPSAYPTPEETSSLSRFLLNRGSVLAAGMFPDSFVSRPAATVGDPRFGGVECKAVAPTHLTRGGSISQDGTLAWNSTDSSQLVHFTDPKGNAVVVSYAVGKGSVVWWASAWPLENAGIREKNNLELLLNSTSGYQRVLWDEYYQNPHQQTSNHKPVRAVSWALGQFAMIALAIVLTYSRRSGPLVPRLEEPRGSPMEFVVTLASVFQRARSTHVAVEIAFQRFRQVAVRRLGIRGTANAAEIVEAMAHHGIRLSKSTAELVRQSELTVGTATLPERSAMALVHALNEATQAMDPSRRSSSPQTSNENSVKQNFKERN